MAGMLRLKLGVFDHLHAIAFHDLAFKGDGLGSFGRELIVDRFVVANDQIQLVVAQQADGATVLDTFSGAALMLLAFGAMVEVAHEIDDFAGNGLSLAGGSIIGGQEGQRLGEHGT